MGEREGGEEGRDASCFLSALALCSFPAHPCLVGTVPEGGPSCEKPPSPRPMPPPFSPQIRSSSCAFKILDGGSGKALKKIKKNE